jgi:molecular chaperone GrpE
MNDTPTVSEQSESAPAGQESANAGAVENLEELRKKAGERDQYLSLAQRTRAEFENYQKRNQREREQERQYMAGQFLLEMLPVLDNIERATLAAQQAGEQGPLVQGVGMVRQQFLDMLKRHGVTRIEAEGQPFDASRHQAIAQMESADQPANTVVQVAQQGYVLHDRVLRPAGVVVSKAPASGALAPAGDKKSK